MNTQPIHAFKSHIAGRNADLCVYADRVEWTQARKLSVGKVAAATLSVGMTALATGLKSGSGSVEVLPMRQISRVSTRRAGMFHTIVELHTGTGVVDAKLSHDEARQVRDTVAGLLTV